MPMPMPNEQLGEEPMPNEHIAYAYAYAYII